MEVRKVMYDLLVDMFVSGVFINLWEFTQVTSRFKSLTQSVAILTPRNCFAALRSDYVHVRGTRKPLSQVRS